MNIHFHIMHPRRASPGRIEDKKTAHDFSRPNRSMRRTARRRGGTPKHPAHRGGTKRPARPSNIADRRLLRRAWRAIFRSTGFRKSRAHTSPRSGALNRRASSATSSSNSPGMPGPIKYNRSLFVRGIKTTISRFILPCCSNHSALSAAEITLAIWSEARRSGSSAKCA